jgi:hypothetical protein
VPLDRRKRRFPLADSPPGLLHREEVERFSRRGLGVGDPAFGSDLAPSGVGLAGRGDKVLLAAFQEALCLAPRLLHQELVLPCIGLISEDEDRHDAEEDEDEGQDPHVRRREPEADAVEHQRSGSKV